MPRVPSLQVPFATMLGMYAEQDKMAAATRDDNRYFKSSLRVTFATNVVASLHACTSEDDAQVSYKVRFLYNEQEVTIPACADEGAFCDLGTVRTAFAAPLGEWEYEEVCDGTCTCEWWRSVGTSGFPSEMNEIHVASSLFSPRPSNLRLAGI